MTEYRDEWQYRKYIAGLRARKREQIAATEARLHECEIELRVFDEVIRELEQEST